MKKSFALVWVLSLAALPACNSTSQDYERSLSQELGLPVTLDSRGYDECAWAQADSLIAEYQALSPAARNEFRRRLREHHSGMRLRSTEISQTFSGLRAEVELAQGVFLCRDPFERTDDSCELTSDTLLESRVLVHDLRATGAAPRTDVLPDPVLTITPRRSESTARFVVYKAYNRRDFDQIRSPLEAEAMEKQGRFWQQYDHVRTQVVAPYGEHCSAPAKLADLAP